ncbi:MAG: ferredoxin [Myxococcales bacterium]|nr:ferredoxin [Myxococcales bacterium]MDH3486116.1 ferredoxin [Myxococcales bacterium]
MKIMYNESTCNRYGVCVEEAPEVFSFAEDGSLVVATYQPLEELQDKVRDACMMCPTQSLEVEEE